MAVFYSMLCVLVVLWPGTSYVEIGFGTEINGLIALGLTLILFIATGVQVINQWDRLVILRLGKFSRVIGPGLCWVNPLIEVVGDEWSIYDQVWERVIQNVQTKDNVPLSFSLILTTQVTNSKDATVNVDDLFEAVGQRAQACANGAVRDHNLDEIMVGGPFSGSILKSLNE